MNPRCFLSLFIGAMWALLSLTGCGKKSDDGAKAAAGDFMQSVIAGDYPAAYQKGSMKFRTQTRFDEFTFEAGTLRVPPEAKPTWGELQDKDGSPVIHGTVPRESGDPAKFTLELTKEIEEWKVAKFDVE